MQETTPCQTVAVGLIAYNERAHLPSMLSDILRQTYPHQWMDVILVDGGSQDGTRALMEAFVAAHGREFRRAWVLDNPKKIQPAGWNAVLSRFDADVLVRLDAHGGIAPDFVEKTMACLNDGEAVCGGSMESITDNPTPWGQTLLKAETSLFGGSVGAFKRQSSGRRPVSTVSFPAYRKEVVERVGRFNETLQRTEDNEYSYRVRQAGYSICLDSAIRCRYVIRGSLKSLLLQKVRNGLWIGRTLFCCPRCLSWYHLVPGLFVGAAAVTGVLALLGIRWPCQALWGAYGGVNLLMWLRSKIERPTDLCLPLLFLALHVSYGLGTLWGIICGAAALLARRNP